MRDYRNRAHGRFFAIENIIFVNFRESPGRPALFRSRFRFGGGAKYQIIPIRVQHNQ